MQTTNLAKIVAAAALVAVPLAISSISVAQAPPPRPAPIMAPSIPPAHVLDLMTAQGSAALGAQGRVSDVKIVEVPASQAAMPQSKTAYTIEPTPAGPNFDDSKWPVIAPKDLAP